MRLHLAFTTATCFVAGPALAEKDWLMGSGAQGWRQLGPAGEAAQGFVPPDKKPNASSNPMPAKRS
jgi:hypothetical protein